MDCNHLWEKVNIGGYGHFMCAYCSRTEPVSIGLTLMPDWDYTRRKLLKENPKCKFKI